MLYAEIICWVSFAVLFYCYIGYGILAFIIVFLRSLFSKQKEESSAGVLPVTLIVTAYNEEKILPQKIANTLAIDYPAGQLQFIFITDGSSDSSATIIGQYPQIRLLHQPERKGKYAAIKRAMPFVQSPVVIFSDANTMLNSDCVRQLVRHYTDPKIGGVAGEKKIVVPSRHSAVGEAEGLYWRYESFMKKLDASLHTVVGAAGELFSIRTTLFKSFDDGLILDDFVISMDICLQGYKIAYEPLAFAQELPSASLAEEAKRKIRISAGAYQSIRYLEGCLNIFRHPVLSFQFISRRLLRWVFCPVMLLLFLVSTVYLLINAPHSWIYQLLVYGQVVFYAAAAAGWAFVRSGKSGNVFMIPFYFVFMNYCLVRGFFRFVKGNQSSLWEKAERE